MNLNMKISIQSSKNHMFLFKYYSFCDFFLHYEKEQKISAKSQSLWVHNLKFAALWINKLSIAN